MDEAERAAKREQTVQAIMGRAGKTRGQAEALCALVAQSMGWAPRAGDDEFQALVDTFVGRATPNGEG